MNKDKSHECTWVFLVGMLISVIMVTASLFSQYESIQFASNDLTSFNNEWIVNGEKISLPSKIEYNKGETVVMENNLPERFPDQSNLFFFSYYSNLEVYVDNELIYSFGANKNYLFTDNPGYFYLLVPLQKKDEGEKIRIEFSSNYISKNIEVPSIFVGTSGAVFHKVIVSSAFVVISSALIFIISLYFVFQSLIHSRKTKNFRGLIYLGISGILFAIAASIKTQLWQFFNGNSLFMYFLVDYCLMVLPITLVLCFKNLFGFFNQILCRVVLFICLTNIIASTIFEITGFMSIANSTIFTNLVNIIAIASIYFNIFKYRKNLNTTLMYGTMVFISALLIDTIRNINYPGATSYLSIIGNIIFLFYVGKKTMDQLTLEIQEGYKYKDIAYHDTLTGAYTLMALNENILKLNETKNYGVAVFDLNSLKYYNDKFGHSVGDYMLTTAVKILNQAFKKFKYVYRIGGDEFLVVLPNASKQDFQDSMETLIFLETQASSMKVMKGESINIEFAYGFALCENGESFEQVRKKADEYMYSKKNELKK